MQEGLPDKTNKIRGDMMENLLCPSCNPSIPMIKEFWNNKNKRHGAYIFRCPNCFEIIPADFIDHFTIEKKSKEPDSFDAKRSAINGMKAMTYDEINKYSIALMEHNSMLVKRLHRLKTILKYIDETIDFRDATGAT